jgi:hypothetical protein
VLPPQKFDFRFSFAEGAGQRQTAVPLEMPVII